MWSLIFFGFKVYNKVVELYNFVLINNNNIFIFEFVKIECEFLVKLVLNDNFYFFGKFDIGYFILIFDVVVKN